MCPRRSTRSNEGPLIFVKNRFQTTPWSTASNKRWAHSTQVLALRQQRQMVQTKLNQLTERERDVMNRVAAGLPNKLVADALHISVRTVEVHRARVFDKLEVKSAVELANLLRGVA